MGYVQAMFDQRLPVSYFESSDQIFISQNLWKTFWA